MATDKLLKHERLSKNTLWNIISQFVPALAAILAIPKLIEEMGTDRFGLLTICWMISGYFSLLDFGIGRALTQKIAGTVSQTDNKSVADLIKNALISSALISLFLMLLLLGLSTVLIDNVLHVNSELRNEALISFVILSFSLPLMIGAASLRGVLESIQRFDLVNVVRVPTSTLSFLFPLITLMFSNQLQWVLLTLVFFRAVTFFFYWFFCIRIFPSLGRLNTFKSSIKMTQIKALFKSGGWMTISSIISPIMSQMDRFFIGNILTISAVAYYTTPYEMVSKIWIITGAIAGVIFPAVATSLATQSKKDTQEILNKGTRSIVILVLPVVCFFILFAQEGLAVWLGSEMSVKTIFVTQILALGFYYNSIANVPFAFIQASDRADLTAKIHLFEVIIYIPIIVILIKYWGVEGAAVAWSARVLIDLLLLTYFERKLLSSNRLRKTALLVALSTLICLGFFYLSLVLSVYFKVLIGIITGISVLTVVRSWSLKNRIFLPVKGASQS